jgi:hypothetical protein
VKVDRFQHLWKFENALPVLCSTAYIVDRKMAIKSDHQNLNDLPVAAITNVAFNMSLIITPEKLVFYWKWITFLHFKTPHGHQEVKNVRKGLQRCNTSGAFDLLLSL